MNAFVGSSPSNGNSAEESKAAAAFVGQQHRVFKLAVGISLVIVATSYLRQRQFDSHKGVESSVVWGLALGHILVQTVSNKAVHLFINFAVICGAIAYWASNLIESPTEALFVQLLLLTVLQAFL